MIENYAEKIKHESNGFIRHNGIRIVSVDEERSVLEAEITDNSRNVWGSVHGGFLYTMADTAAGAFARIKYGRRNVTLNGSMNYLRPTTRSRTLTAVGIREDTQRVSSLCLILPYFFRCAVNRRTTDETSRIAAAILPAMPAVAKPRWRASWVLPFSPRDMV